jgi:hypothetical protein
MASAAEPEESDVTFATVTSRYEGKRGYLVGRNSEPPASVPGG